jgi:hypothetical protein
MTNKKKDAENQPNHAAENLESVGQLIIGGIETIGGILTGDPTTRAEGDFNQQVGSLRQETNKNLTAAADSSDEAEKTRADKASETEK